MSNNVRYSKIVGNDEYDLKNLSNLPNQARAEKRYIEREMKNGSEVRIRYGHLKHDVLGVAIKEFEATTGISLPWNLNKVNEWGGISKIDESLDFHPREGVQELVRTCTQLAGWLRAAAKLPGVTRMLGRTQSPNGMGSPYTTVNLWDFVAKNPSPGRLERQLWKVRRRAQKILSAWEGDYHPSWASIARALCVTKSIGKAAVIVAVDTLTDIRDDNGNYRKIDNYKEAREILVSVRSASFPVADNSDGVNARRKKEPTLSKLGCQVYRIRLTDQYGRYSLQWLVTSNSGRTYHSDWGGAREALQQALRAWRQQDNLQAIDAELVGFLNGDEGYTPLVYMKDSYDAGNCSVGTASWLRDRGWYGREFVPGRWLVQYLGYNLVRNVAVKVFQGFH